MIAVNLYKPLIYILYILYIYIILYIFIYLYIIYIYSHTPKKRKGFPGGQFLYLIHMSRYFTLSI